MRGLNSVALFLLLTLSLGEPLYKPFPEQYLTFTSYCEHFGYATQEHQIVTTDGYVLQFFRVQKTGPLQQGLKPVYLQHGLLDSSDTFIVNYQSQAPAFVLADAGFDVWVGNARGNKYSKGHITLDSKSKEYWDFSWSEMADHDLPAAFKYIARTTNQPKIDYVGHSQGTLTMFAALSQRDPYIQKYLGKFISLAPIVSMRHQKSTVLHTMAAIDKLQDVLNLLGIHQVLEYTNLTSHTTATVCALAPELCSEGLKLFSDFKPALDHIERLPVVMGHYPAGASLWDVSHFVQMMHYKEFSLQRYDWGRTKNLLKYGSVVPPVFDLKNIQSDLYLFYGVYDLLADEQDVTELIEVLREHNPNLTVRSYEAGHATFIWGENDDIMRDILSVLRGDL